MKEYLKYLYNFVKVQGISVDWQGMNSLNHIILLTKGEIDFEDSETIVFYSIRLLEKNSNIVTVEERSNNSTLFHLSIESESVLNLAYYANQVQCKSNYTIWLMIT
jgi:hypothetical protein